MGSFFVTVLSAPVCPPRFPIISYWPDLGAEAPGFSDLVIFVSPYVLNARDACSRNVLLDSVILDNVLFLIEYCSMLVNDLKLVLDEFELTQVELAKLVSVTPRAVNMWMQGDREIPGPVEAYIRLFSMLPAAARATERARAAGKEKIMREGMYQIQFHTAGDPLNWGVGTLVFDGGKIYGIDAGEAKYDGDYQLSQNSALVDVKLKVTFPPNGMSIFGIAHPFEWAIEVRTQLDPKKDSGPLTATTNLGHQVQASYSFVRSMPEAA
jgi:hypothetical protein